MLSNETATEFTTLKQQVVDAASEVLLQVKDTMLPAYESQVIASVQAQCMNPHIREVNGMLHKLRTEVASVKLQA